MDWQFYGLFCQSLPYALGAGSLFDVILITFILFLKDAMENSVEIVIEKLLHVTKDVVPKVSNEPEHCLSIVLSQYPFKCLSVIVPLLVTKDDKTLVTCINYLTKASFHQMN